MEEQLKAGDYWVISHNNSSAVPTTAEYLDSGEWYLHGKFFKAIHKVVCRIPEPSEIEAAESANAALLKRAEDAEAREAKCRTGWDKSHAEVIRLRDAISRVRKGSA